MKIEPRYDVLEQKQWKRQINGKRFMFRWSKYRNGTVVLDASVWTQTCWNQIHHINLWPPKK